MAAERRPAGPEDHPTLGAARRRSARPVGPEQRVARPFEEVLPRMRDPAGPAASELFDAVEVHDLDEQLLPGCGLEQHATLRIDTDAPAPAKPNAIDLPIPLLPPATTTRLSLKLISIECPALLP